MKGDTNIEMAVLTALMFLMGVGVLVILAGTR